MLTPSEVLSQLHKQTDVPIYNHIEARMYLRSGQEMIRMVGIFYTSKHLAAATDTALSGWLKCELIFAYYSRSMKTCLGKNPRCWYVRMITIVEVCYFLNNNWWIWLLLEVKPLSMTSVLGHGLSSLKCTISVTSKVNKVQMLNIKQCKINWGQFIYPSFIISPHKFLVPNFFAPSFLAPIFCLICRPLFFGPIIFWPQFLCGGEDLKSYVQNFENYIWIFEFNVGLAIAKLSSSYCQLCSMSPA